ncbi:LruC domain-containing protein [Leptospira idonii]|uniref:LruC domain-containing protein n=1 Tax=Leptospira idonii TaxID=1193500 RepID=A0A4R9M187_9LEPT|nr:LruC domain-containing protein [Leptospira idonii]TGN19585.1 LruC domain-containing protein [Leptospira idonii]
MKKWIILLAIPLLVLDCSNKKKGLLLPLFAALGGDNSAATQTPAAGQTDTGTSSFTVVSLDATDQNQVGAGNSSTNSGNTNTSAPTDSGNSNSSNGSGTSTGSSDSSANNGSPSSGSGSSSDSSGSGTGTSSGDNSSTAGNDNSSNGSGDSSSTTNPPATTTPEVVTPAPVVADTTVSTNTTTTVVNQTNANGGFNFETNVTVPVTVHLVNESGPVANAPVTVTENQSNGETNILGQGTTDTNGTAVIPISVPPTVTQVNVSIVGVNPTNGEVQEVTGSVPVQIPAPTGTTGTVVVAPTTNLNANNFQPVNGCVTAVDSDCDGVANQYDEFPENPALAFIARSGRYTIAFEDLFPDAGDADLNDHTTVFSTEMDKTPTNKVKVLRGVFTHVGKGAGYNHELRLSLDVPVTAKFEISYVDGSGKAWTGCAGATKYVAGATGDCTGGNITAAGLKRGLLILPSSDKTLFGKQNSPAPGTAFTAKDFVRGVTAHVTITFDEAVDLSTAKNMVGGHLNWFLAFNQKTNGVYRQIYRPGYVFGSNGKDTYIDSKGFPWAIIVPGVFNHPTAGSDIRKASTTGYAYFNTWAESNGSQHKDWYTQITNPVYIVRIKDFYTDNGFSAYLIKAVSKNIFEVSASLMVIGAALGFLMKKRIGKKAVN